jgi:hypothetical protein
MSVVTVMEVAGGYRAGPESFLAITRIAKSAKLLRFRTPARLYSYNTLLQRLASHLQDVAATLGEFIQEAHAMVGQRHLARPGEVAPADQPDVRDGGEGGAHGRVVTTAVRRPCEGCGWSQGLQPGSSPAR